MKEWWEIEREELLKNRIEEQVRHELFLQGMILEMAVKRKEYLNRVESKWFTIVNHILLIVYCRLFDNDCQYYNHWKSEVIAWSRELSSLKLKDTSDSKQIEVKKKIIEQIYEIRDAYDVSLIAKLWSSLMIQENLTTKFNQNVFDEYSNISFTIFTYIVNSDANGVTEYIKQL